MFMIHMIIIMFTVMQMMMMGVKTSLETDIAFFTHVTFVKRFIAFLLLSKEAAADQRKSFYSNFYVFNSNFHRNGNFCIW